MRAVGRVVLEWRQVWGSGVEEWRRGGGEVDATLAGCLEALRGRGGGKGFGF